MVNKNDPPKKQREDATKELVEQGYTEKQAAKKARELFPNTPR